MEDPNKYSEFDKKLIKEYGDRYYGFKEKRVVEPVSRISTGCVSLDRVLGGGIPEGRLIEIYGNSSSSKTTVCLQIVSSYQKLGKACLWIDAERCYDPTYATYCGVDEGNIAILQPKSANDALEVIRMACDSGLINLVVLDSTAALVPSDEYEKDAGGGMIGSIARLMSQMLKQIINLGADNKCTVIFINQKRASNITG